MFAKIFALFAMLAVAFAAPNPKPLAVTYSTGYDYAYPAAAAYSYVPSVYSSYPAALPYSVPAYTAAPYYYK